MSAPNGSLIVEYGLSTSMVQHDLDRLALFERFGGTHVEIGFVSEAALDVVLEVVDRLGRSRGFHDPTPYHPRWRWPSMTDPDRTEQARSLGVMAATLSTLDGYGADYALTHFPSVHFEPVPGWSRERALEAAHEAASTMARWGAEREVRILLENVGPNPYWDAAAWCEIFETYPGLAFCLDVGHLHLETRADHDANLAFARALAPYTRQIHLYNATLESYRTHHHVPAHPEQDPAEGWIDLPALLGAIVDGRRGTLRIIFEHTPESGATEDHVAEGMDWVRRVVIDATERAGIAVPGA